MSYTEPINQSIDGFMAEITAFSTVTNPDELANMKSAFIIGMGAMADLVMNTESVHEIRELNNDLKHILCLNIKGMISRGLIQPFENLLSQSTRKN